MTAGWVVTLGLGAATMAIKALGPVLLGGRRVPPLLLAGMQFLAPALLAGLVVTQGFADGQEFVIDARAAGLAAAGMAVLFRAPALVIIGSAAAVTAVIRLLV
jgi:branched-subunit amino acid transport protein